MRAAALIAVGVGLLVVVGRDGTAGWRVVRALVVLLVCAGTARLVRHGGQGLPVGASELAIGLVATGAGAGVAGPWLAKAGISVVSLAATVALGGGLVLVGAGASTLVRRTPRWWRLLVVPALVAVVLAVVPSLSIAVAATNVPRVAVGPTSPADRGLSYRDVRTRTADGVVLSGWYVPSRNEAAVLVMHGAGSTRSAVLDQGVVLARHGYGVLLLDARGHGGSGGRAMDLGWYGDLDVSAGVDYLAHRPDVSPSRIAVLGESMGGEEAIGAAAADPRIRAVVAEGATGRVAADHRWLVEAYGWRGRAQQVLDRLTYGLADLLTSARPPGTLAAAAAAAHRPILLIAAGRVADEGRAAAAVRAASPADVSVWVVPGSGHSGGLDARPAAWERRVTDFLAAALGRRAVR